MALKVLPPSPNWYLSSASDANEAGIYVFAARNVVYVFDVSTPREGPNLQGFYSNHYERVTSVALCPDGKLRQLSSESKEGEQAEDVSAVGLEAADSGVSPEESACANVPAQALCCSGGDDMTVRIWDVNTYTDVQTHQEHKEKITCAAWSPVNTLLVASGDEKGDVIVWNRKSQTAMRWKPEKDYIICVTFSPHEPALLAVGVRKGTVYLVDFSSGGGHMVHRLRGHEEEVMSVSWCPILGEMFLKESDEPGDEEDAEKSTERCLIATGSKDRTIRVWSRSRGRQLFYKKLPIQRREHGDQGRTRAWVAVSWLKSNPEQLVSSSSSGDLLVWNLKYSKGQAYASFYTGEFRPHFRPVFNICASGPDGNTLCTFAQDRSLLLWDAVNTEALCSLPTLGGHGYCVRNSPVDSGRVAIGVGDNMIRVWNTSSKTNLYDITTHWQGIKNKVTAVAWHPTKEGTLGFGTDDGRVGVLDVFSQRMPVMSSTFHDRTVYVVTWGPSTAQPESFSLYSVGDLEILEHSGAALSRSEEKKVDATNITAVLVKINSEKLEAVKACEMSWNPDFTAFAVGAYDGTIYLFSGKDQNLLAMIKVHTKLINCVRWHPKATDQSPSGSPCQYWMASGGNDQVLHVVDLSKILRTCSEDVEQNVVITSSLRQFTGHSERITDLSWSPHHDGRLVSAGYGAEVFVWDVQKGVPICQFRGHQGRVLTCQYSGLDPDLVMTSGSDATVLVWRVSEQPEAEFGEKKKKKKKRPAASTASQNVPQESSDTTPQQESIDATAAAEALQEMTLEIQGLQQQLEKKRVELMAKESGGEGTVKDKAEMVADTVTAELTGMVELESSLPSASNEASVTQLGVAGPTREVPTSPKLPPTPVDEGPGSEEEAGEERKSGVATTRGEKTAFAGQRGKGSALDGAKKKRRQKSYFPETAKADNRGRAAVHEDLLVLTSIQFAGSETGGGAEESDSITTTATPSITTSPVSSELPADRQHLGLFTDRKGTYQCLKKEVVHHVNHDNMEYALQMEVWKGNVLGAIQLARERQQLSDWIVSLAPLASYEVWLAVCEEYAEQLEEEGQYHKAVSYLLASHKLYPAIDLFRRHKLFREAVALAKVRLSPLDPVLEDLYTDWSEQLMRDGAYEQAAKCYLAMKHIQDAAKVIARRCDQTSLQTACHMTLLANEKHQGQLYAQQVVTRYLAAQQWKQALAFLKEHQPLKVFVPYVSVHEMVLRELSTMVPDIVPAIDSSVSDTWGTTPVDKLGIPEFILDPKEADPVLPWDLHLVAGHSFPHHMLRMWHLNLGVPMETEQLHLVYHALQQLQSGRQAHLDTQQVLLQVCGDITLWLLALLTNQTSVAISHLLAALSSLHEGGHMSLLTAICRLLLPLGPKYMLKLQQEVSALCVLINMESHVEVEGGGKHLSLRRYLSEIKDEPSVSTGSTRCRQLDCVRAYFYLSVLHYLEQTFAQETDEVCKSENSASVTGGCEQDSDSAVDKVSSSGEKEEKTKEKVPNSSPVSSGTVVVGCSGGARPKTNLKRNVGSADNGPKSGLENGIKETDSHYSDGGDRSHNTRHCLKGGSAVGKGDGNTDTETKTPLSPASKDPTASLSPKKRSPEKGGATIQSTSVLEKGHPSGQFQKSVSSGQGPSPNSDLDDKGHQGQSSLKDSGNSEQRKRTTSEQSEPWVLTLPRLLQLSKGLLWDLQAKRLALTDTLGYIHRAISQHLLTDRSREVAKTLSRHTSMGSAHNHNHTTLHNHHTHAPALPDTVAAHLPHDPFLDIEDTPKVTSENEESVYASFTGAGIASSQNDSESMKLSAASNVLSSSSSSFSSNGMPALNADCLENPPSSSSQTSVPNLAVPDSNFDLDLATLGQQWDGSRRVLWEDDPISGSVRKGDRVGGDSGSHKPTCLLSPAKYINVPDEWYSLPVDEKYGRSYVTLAILKDEQDFVMGELKRMSDSSQVPFPNPFSSIELLLNVCLGCTTMPTEDKHDYVKSLQSWAMHFAVTSQQRSQADSLFARAEKAIGL